MGMEWERKTPYPLPALPLNNKGRHKNGGGGKKTQSSACLRPNTGVRKYAMIGRKNPKRRPS